ncbi:MAG: DoxX family protein [Candidatus Eiseniibacteriota bacterium]
MTIANSADRSLTLNRGAGPVALVLSIFDGLGRLPHWIIPLMARLAVAGVFWRSGMVKIASWDQTVALFRDEYQVPVLPPEIAAYLGTTLELACPVLLFFGFAARLGALGLLGMTFVIEVFVYPNNWPEHLTWATLLLIVLTRGAGPVSLDHLIRTRLFNR